MKIIEALVNPIKVRAVRDALCSIGIDRVSVGDEKGSEGGREYRLVVHERGRVRDIVPRAKIELVVHDRQAEDAVTMIVNAAKVVEMGGSDTIIAGIEDSIRIRPEKN